MKTLLWVLRLIPALILLQTLYFKFMGQPESVELFTKLGVEPWGRYATGIFELIAGILLLIPSRSYMGALLAIGLMMGAIGSHLLALGIESNNDGGLLFILAIVVLFTSCILLFLEKNKLSILLNTFKR